MCWQAWWERHYWRSASRTLESHNCRTSGLILAKLGGTMQLVTDWPKGVSASLEGVTCLTCVDMCVRGLSIFGNRELESAPQCPVCVNVWGPLRFGHINRSWCDGTLWSILYNVKWCHIMTSCLLDLPFVIWSEDSSGSVCLFCDGC